MKKVINFFADSFRNDKAGGSARKLTAFTLIALVVGAFVFWYRALYYSISINDKVTITSNWATSIFVEILIVLLGGSAFFLGIVTIQNLLELKNGRKSTETINNEPNQP